MAKCDNTQAMTVKTFVIWALFLCFGCSAKLLKEMKYNQNYIDTPYETVENTHISLQHRDTLRINRKSGCVLKMIETSRSLFRHIVYYSDLNFVYFHINVSQGISFQKNEHIISPTLWTWTYHGTDGALEYLSWPLEFGVWSMGLLNSYVGNIKVRLEKATHSGDCTNLNIGHVNDNNIIAKALIQAVQTLTEMGPDQADQYGPSQLCYKERVYINPHSKYLMCKHIICPFEAMQYVCCSNTYRAKYNNRTMSCKNPYRFGYDDLWWVGPIVISLILFIYTPMTLMKMASCFTSKQSTPMSKSSYEEICKLTDFVFYDGRRHVTLFNTLASPLILIFTRFETIAYRMVRFLLPWISLLFIGIQIYIDNGYLKQFVLDGVDHSVPLGFRSMLAGYHKSANNFLPCFGGPFVALGIYLMIACGVITLPKSLADHLESGLPDNADHTTKTTLCLNTAQKEQYGNIDVHYCSGFKKIYHVLLAQFFMLINKRYWSDSISKQKQRWESWNTSKCHAILFPIYLIICIIEHTLCVIFFGLPIVFLSYVIVCSYYNWIIRIKHSKVLRSFSCIAIPLLLLFLVVSMVIFLFMFCVIFLDGCLFLTRIFIFTYTGIIMYPKFSYGYIIFALTSVYYLWESVKDFSLKYDQLLKSTIRVCKMYQRANDREQLVTKVEIYSGVREYVFEQVIERVYPRRKLVFLALFRLAIILSVIGVSIGLLTKTDRLKELHILVHVSTAIFTCAIPKITRSIFGKPVDKLRQRMFEEQIRKALAESFTNSFSLA